MVMLIVGSFFNWKEKHPLEYKLLKEKAEHSPKSVFIPKPVVLSVGGESIEVDGGIKSTEPPCLGVAYNLGPDPFTCSNCQMQKRELKNLLSKRKNASLKQTNNILRVGKRGFRVSYAKHEEELKTLKITTKAKKETAKTSTKLIKQIESQKQWTDFLYESCLKNDEP